MGSKLTIKSTNNYGPYLNNSIIIGSNHIIDLGAEYKLYGATGTVPGNGDQSYTVDDKGIALFGRYAKYDYNSNPYDILLVGSGTSSSKNCFAAGDDPNNGCYLKIGSTILTETQLQALLATL